ncbi:sulfur carrier protein ThiS [mine drainage metagenome]|jgi:sulfur carrier protein|uniref:Sulfur carrier protein ThiS n=1 Tax=mine drainage metagenome TaxID=410659 RepID=A0A1J5QAC8_9ZZZZ
MPHDVNARVAAPAALALSVNGEHVASAAATLVALLAERGFAGGGFACAVNGQFVPRARWAEHMLADGDCIDVVAPVTGG